MTTEILWVDELPVSGKGRPKDTWFDAFIEPLKAKAGAWAQLFVGPKGEVQAKATNIRNNYEDFDVTVRRNPENVEEYFLFVSAKAPEATPAIAG